jgi:hypothetical protein
VSRAIAASTCVEELLCFKASKAVAKLVASALVLIIFILLLCSAGVSVGQNRRASARCIKQVAQARNIEDAKDNANKPSTPKSKQMQVLFPPGDETNAVFCR